MKTGVVAAFAALLLVFSTEAAVELSDGGGTAETIVSLEQVEAIVRNTQQQFWQLVPPSSDDPFYLHSEQVVRTVDWNSKEWPRSVLKQMYAEMQSVNSSMYPFYRMTVVETRTGEMVYYNSYDQEVWRTPAPLDYNPYLFAFQCYDVGSVEELNEQQQIFGRSSNVGTTVLLLPATFIESYEQDIAMEAQSVALAEPMAMMSMPAVVTDLMIGIDSPSNGAVELELRWPDGFTNEVELYSAENLQSNWVLASGKYPTIGETNLFLSMPSITPECFFRFGDATTDTDGEGLPDARELIVTKTAINNSDSDGDGMTDSEEAAYGLDPLVEDHYKDLDGDRYPNIYELKNGSAPNDGASIPGFTGVTTVGPGQSFTDIQSAYDHVRANGVDYSIIHVLPGAYSPVFLQNAGIARKVLLISRDGPATTSIDANGADTSCLRIDTESIVDGFMLENSTESGKGSGIYIYGADGQVNHCVVRNNASLSVDGTIYLQSCNPVFRNCLVYNNTAEKGGGVRFYYAYEATFINCTFFNNQGVGNSLSYDRFASATHLLNCILWGDGQNGTQEIEGALFGFENLHFSSSIVKNVPVGCVLDGSNSTDDPCLDSDGHLTANSTAAINRAGELGLLLDIDLTSRPIDLIPDIGADEFEDPDIDSDGMFDAWELTHGLDPTRAVGDDGANGDPDGDGFRNIEEYAYSTHPNDNQSTIVPMGYVYDDIDRITDIDYPNGRTVTYGYDGDGNLEEVR